MMLSGPVKETPDSPTPPAKMFIFSPNIPLLFEKALRLQSALAAKALFEKNQLMQNKLALILQKICQAKQQCLASPIHLRSKFIATSNELSASLVVVSDEMNRLNLMAIKFQNIQASIDALQLRLKTLGFSEAFDYDMSNIINTNLMMHKIFTKDLNENIMEVVYHACNAADDWSYSLLKKLKILQEDVTALEKLPAAEQRIKMAKLTAKNGALTALAKTHNLLCDLDSWERNEAEVYIGQLANQINKLAEDNTLSDEKKTEGYQALTAKLQYRINDFTAKLEEREVRKKAQAQENQRAPAYR